MTKPDTNRQTEFVPATGASGAASANITTLGLIAEIAVLLQHGATTEDVLTGVASALNRAWRNDSCRVWVSGSVGLRYRAYSGRGVAPPSPEAAEAISTRAIPGEAYDEVRDLRRLWLPLTHRGDRVGLLEASVPGGPETESYRQVAEIVAGMLTPVVAFARASGSMPGASSSGSAAHVLTSEIVDSLPFGLYVIDRDYRVLTWNRHRESGTLVDKDHAVGRSIFDVLRRLPRDRLRSEFDSVFRTGRAEQVDVESTHTGEPRHHRITKVPLRVGDGEVSHVITIAEDLTDWMSVQKQQVALAEKLGAVGQLAAGVMHELNNPLATIGACVEALSVRSPGLSDSVRTVFEEYLRIIDSELDRCKSIVDGLLDFSRPTSRAKRLCDANQIVDDALFLVKHHDKFRHIQLERQLTDGLPWIEANTEQLIQVCVALMLNAIDAMQRTGVLTITTERNPENEHEIVVHVSDTGVGIPKEDLPKLFEPFFTSKQPGQGTGLGLAICYSIVAQHEGRILVDSIVDQGSTFSVFLPVASRKE